MLTRALVSGWLFANLAASPFALAQKGSADYSSLDNHALAAPREAERSYETLAGYLVSPAKNDGEKVRVIFRWITQNISYDTKGFFSGTLSASSAKNALKEKKAGCDGYAGLFEQLAKVSNLEVVKISGFAKGYGFIAGSTTDQRPNHAWNAVRIEGQWRLLDCTWGAGSIDERKQFRRQFQDHYFLTPPEEFIYDHFPTEAQWQLLDPPVSREQFEKFVYLRPGFFHAGLKLKSHTTAGILANDGVTITLEAPEDALVMAMLSQGEKKLDDTFTFCHRSERNIEIRCVFPHPGTYIARLFAKKKNDPGAYNWALDYRVDAQKGGSQQFPKTYGMFMAKGCSLSTPLSGMLSSASEQEFQMKVPEAEQVALIQSGTWTFLTENDGVFSGKVVVRKGELQVAAKFPGSDVFQTLLSFTGR